MIEELRAGFNRESHPLQCSRLLAHLEHVCGSAIGFRVADTPVFFPRGLLDSMADAGAQMALALIDNRDYLEAAHAALPSFLRFAGETPHPNFLSADFALIDGEGGTPIPQLLEISGFASIYSFQAILCEAYRSVFALDKSLGTFLGGVDEAGFWTLFTRTVFGTNDPAHVVLAALDPAHHSNHPEFEATARRLGLTLADPRSFVSVDNRLHYCGQGGQSVPIHRIYNRFGNCISNGELIEDPVNLPFDKEHPWNVEWAGHPNWSFLVGRFALPWLARPPLRHALAAPTVFLDDFLERDGRAQLESAGVRLPHQAGSDTLYRELLLKPLFSSSGQRTRIAPLQGDLDAIVPERRREYVLQQRVRSPFVIETPSGPAEVGIRILYLWPDQGLLTPVLPAVRLERKIAPDADGNGYRQRMCISAAFFPRKQDTGEVAVQLLPG